MVKDLLSMWASEHSSAYKKSMLLVRKKSMTTGFNLLLIAGTLTLMLVGWIIIGSIQHWSLHWQQGEARIALYLSATCSAQAETDLLVKIRATPGVLALERISAEQGLIELQKKPGMQAVLHDLPVNPLPVVLNITHESWVNTPQKLKKLYAKVTSDPLVKHATLDLEWLEQVQYWAICLIGIIRAGMILIVCLVLLNIGHSLRLMVAERTSDISLLLRMGANESWIMRPFLYLGGCYGLVGACVASVVVELICYAGNQLLFDSSNLLGWQPAYFAFSFIEAMIFIMASTCCSWIFAFFFVRHHLRSLDCFGCT